MQNWKIYSENLDSLSTRNVHDARPPFFSRLEFVCFFRAFLKVNIVAFMCHLWATSWSFRGYFHTISEPYSDDSKIGKFSELPARVGVQTFYGVSMGTLQGLYGVSTRTLLRLYGDSTMFSIFMSFFAFYAASTKSLRRLRATRVYPQGGEIGGG